MSEVVHVVGGMSSVTNHLFLCDLAEQLCEMQHKTAKPGSKQRQYISLSASHVL